ncbi:Dual specificity protein phosphatase 14 [Trebouxia sp. C0009 RCD-2024]
MTVRDPVNQILPYLHLGSVDVYENDEFFNKHLVELIINCYKNHETPLARRSTLTVLFKVEDINDLPPERRATDSAKMSDLLPALLELMHTHVSKGQHVLVHCKHGAQRSATIVVAYVRTYRKDLYSAIKPAELAWQWTHQDLLNRSIQVVYQQRKIFDTYIRKSDGKECTYVSFEEALKKLDKQLYKEEKRSK